MDKIYFKNQDLSYEKYSIDLDEIKSLQEAISKKKKIFFGDEDVIRLNNILAGSPLLTVDDILDSCFNEDHNNFNELKELSIKYENKLNDLKTSLKRICSEDAFLKIENVINQYLF